jgi:large subunit ribosomal protein L9
MGYNAARKVSGRYDMKVLLTQDVFNLGHAGDVKSVADGYGRNFLLPRGMAILATPSALKRAERLKTAAVEKRARNKADIDALSSVIGGSTFTFNVRAGEKGKLFGSITATQIADAITEKLGSEFDKRKVALREPIRDVGTYTVPIRLSADASPTVTVVVQPEGVQRTVAPVAEAPAQAAPEAAEAEPVAEAEAAPEAAASDG